MTKFIKENNILNGQVDCNECLVLGKICSLSLYFDFLYYLVVI
jgi:hypothetical protein